MNRAPMSTQHMDKKMHEDVLELVQPAYRIGDTIEIDTYGFRYHTTHKVIEVEVEEICLQFVYPIQERPAIFYTLVQRSKRTGKVQKRITTYQGQLIRSVNSAKEIKTNHAHKA